MEMAQGGRVPTHAAGCSDFWIDKCSEHIFPAVQERGVRHALSLGSRLKAVGQRHSHDNSDAVTAAGFDSARICSIVSRSRVFKASTWRRVIPAVEMGSPTVSVISPG